MRAICILVCTFVNFLSLVLVAVYMVKNLDLGYENESYERG